MVRDLLNQLLENVPPGWHRVILILLAIVSVGYLGYLQWQVDELETKNSHLEQLLAPFQAAALKAYPGEEQTDAINKLSERVELLAIDLAGHRATNVLAQVENCYTEATRNIWTLDYLSKTALDRITTGQLQIQACSALSLNTSLPTFLRSALVLYRPKVLQLQAIHTNLLQTCDGRNLVPENVDTTRLQATELTRQTDHIKRDLAAFLELNGRPIPIEELTTPEGVKAINICPRRP